MLASAAMPRVCEDVLELVGDTALVRLRNVGREAPRAEIWAKMEQQNPAGSVKDRIALAMLDAAAKSGALAPGGTVVEPTSGNTGIALAMACAMRGYRCILTMPESMSLERRQLLQAYGAELVLPHAEEQMEGAVARAEALGRETPGAFLPHQFDNAANPRVHFERTAPEILAALGDRPIDAFVAAVGTGGTVSGVGKALKQVYPACRVIAVEPDTCATISRGERGPSKIQGIAAGFVPKNYAPEFVDEVRTISDRRAYETKHAIGRKQGILVGISAGANVAIALDVARELGPGKTVVTVLCDTGERYFSLDEHFNEGTG